MHIYLFICHSQNFIHTWNWGSNEKKESQTFPFLSTVGKRAAELMVDSWTNVSLPFPAAVSNAVLHITPQSYRSNTFLLLLQWNSFTYQAGCKALLRSSSGDTSTALCLISSESPGKNSTYYYESCAFKRVCMEVEAGVTSHGVLSLS